MDKDDELRNSCSGTRLTPSRAGRAPALFSDMDKAPVNNEIELRIEDEPVKNPKGLLDVTELVRSLQRQEGCPDCFRKAQGKCDRMDCFWRPWCL